MNNSLTPWGRWRTFPQGQYLHDELQVYQSHMIERNVDLINIPSILINLSHRNNLLAPLEYWRTSPKGQ